MPTSRTSSRLALIWLTAYAIGLVPTQASELGATGSNSGLPVPRFVSLKSDRVNVRRGPDKDQEVVWVFTRPALPVEITAEFENWRRIRDWEGGEGWVYHSLLSGRRTALVVGRSKDTNELLPLYDAPAADGQIVAQLQPGVLGSVKRCSGDWCRISGDRFDGWIQQARLWGVYLNEKVD
jgi:SH3-like domain-containing protein